MPFLRSQYSRTRQADARSAMAMAIRRALLNAVFEDQLGAAVQFARVYDVWPTAPNRIVVPAACVLPSGPTKYDGARMTPALLRNTWEPSGQQGYGLYKTADLEIDFDVIVRAPSAAERNVLVSGMEDMWTASDQFGQDVTGFQPGSTIPRYGTMLPLPEYWGLCAGFWLLGSRPLDDGQSAIREHWEAICTIRGVGAQVRLGPVQPMKPIVKALFE